MAVAILFCWCVIILGPEEGAGVVVATGQSQGSHALQQTLLYILFYSRKDIN